MRGVRLLGDRRAEVDAFPRPEARAGWAVVRTTVSAVCGSDLHVYRQSAEGVGEKANRVAGHEAVGVVEEVGPGVENFRGGERVLVFQHHGCGRCRFCRSGEPMFCRERRTLGNHVDGANAEFVAAPASSCLPLPDAVSDNVAALMACNFGTAFSGVRKLGLDAGEVVAVYGLGPVGCCAAVVAARDGATVVGIDPNSTRRRLAEGLGLQNLVTIDPTWPDAEKFLEDVIVARGTDAAVDCSGNPGAQSAALEALAPKGRMLVLAAAGQWTIDPSRLWRRGLTLLGSWVYGLGEYEEMARLAELTAASLEKIVTVTFDADRAEEAFEVADGADEGKVLIEWTR